MMARTVGLDLGLGAILFRLVLRTFQLVDFVRPGCDAQITWVWVVAIGVGTSISKAAQLMREVAFVTEATVASLEVFAGGLGSDSLRLH
jgi:hypothetical protein